MKKNDPGYTELSRYYSLWRECNAMYELWAKRHGLSLNSLLILYSFYEDEICTQKQICRKWLIPKQTVNSVLKDFEKQELLKLIPDPLDKRNKQISLTAKGRAYTEAIISGLREHELRVMEQMGIRNMQRMNDALEQFISIFSREDTGTHE